TARSYGPEIGPRPSGTNIASFAIDYAIRYAYDPSTGWMREIESENEFTVDGKRRVDRTAIRAAS
ncbi:MAG: hypothetical protein ACRDY7_13905, partial [Acidimicrobiia bacterium]